MSSQAVAWAIVHKAGSMSAKAVLLSLWNFWIVPMRLAKVNDDQ